MPYLFNNLPFMNALRRTTATLFVTCSLITGVVGALATNTVHATENTLLIVGDSLTAAYGVNGTSLWPELLEEKLRESGHETEVIAAGVSGDTTAGGLRRLPGLLSEHQPSDVLIFLGGNDGLRGTPLNSIKTNLSKMIEQARDAGADVALFSMQIPANYGPRYTRGFEAMYGELAEKYDVTLVPFFEQSLISQPEMIQADGIHPTGKAQPFIAEHILPFFLD